MHSYPDKFENWCLLWLQLIAKYIVGIKLCINEYLWNCAFILLTKSIKPYLLVAGLYSYKPKTDKFVPIPLTNLF